MSLDDALRDSARGYAYAVEAIIDGGTASIERLQGEADSLLGRSPFRDGVASALAAYANLAESERHDLFT